MRPTKDFQNKQLSSVQFSRSVVSDSTPRACTNSCPSSQRCHPTISSSVVPFSSHLQSFPASGSFQMSQFFQWTLRTDVEDGLVGSPCSPRDSQESSPTPQLKSISSSVLHKVALFWPPKSKLLNPQSNWTFKHKSVEEREWLFQSLCLTQIFQKIWCNEINVYTHGRFMLMYGKANTVL